MQNVRLLGVGNPVGVSALGRHADFQSVAADSDITLAYAAFQNAVSVML